VTACARIGDVSCLDFHHANVLVKDPVAPDLAEAKADSTEN
jgi:hypothetical protein